MALTLNGRKRRLARRDFKHFGASLKLTEKQIENAFGRLSRGLASALEVIDAGLYDVGTKERFHALLRERAARVGL